MQDGVGPGLENTIFALIDRYRTLSLDEVMAQNPITEDEKTAQSIALLLVSKRLTAQTWEERITEKILALAERDITPPLYTKKTDFEVQYYSSSTSGKALPAQLTDPEYFTQVINVFFAYLHAKGIHVKHVDLSQAPINDTLELPEGIVTASLYNTMITNKFLQGSLTLKSLSVVRNYEQINGTVDLTLYPVLERFGAGMTCLDNVIVGPSLRALFLELTQCGDIDGVENVEEYTPGEKFTGKKYPAHPTFLGLENCTVAELTRVRELHTINAHIPNVIPYGVRNLDVYLQEDITDLIVPETVEIFTFNPAAIRNPEAFYDRLPEHLKESFERAVRYDYLNIISKEKAFAEGWGFLWQEPDGHYLSSETGMVLDQRRNPPKTELELLLQVEDKPKERFEITGKSPVSNLCNTSVADALIAQGFGEQEAEVLASRYEIVDGMPVRENSKNLVYFVRSADGTVHVVKFVKDKGEAYNEALALYHFSRDPRLQLYVPHSELEIPSLVNVGDEPRYLTVQSFVSGGSTDSLLHGSKKEAMQYSDNWMRIIARLHVYGTEIMDELKNYHPASRLTKPRNEDRIEVANNFVRLVTDKELRGALLKLGLEEGYDFIHQDLREENRKEYKIKKRKQRYCAIDWGNAGRGNCLVDIVRILSDYAVQRHNLSEGDYRNCLFTYYTEKNKLQRVNRTPTAQEINHAYIELNALRLLHDSVQSAYQLSRECLMSEHERRTTELHIATIPQMEQYVKRNLDTLTRLVTQRRQQEDILAA